jgi:hypothetical protein
MKFHDIAYGLALNGLTNVEIFGALELSSAQVQALTLSDVPLLYAIIRGRVDYLRPYVKMMEQEAKGLSKADRSRGAITYIIDRMDNENKMLGLGYDMAVLASAPAVDEETMDAAELTRRLREVK